MLDWAEPRGIGFSHVVSLADMADANFGDMLDYPTSDPHRRAVLLYVEGITHCRKFMFAAGAAARVKPSLVLNADQSQRVHVPRPGIPMSTPMPMPSVRRSSSWSTRLITQRDPKHLLANRARHFVLDQLQGPAV